MSQTTIRCGDVTMTSTGKVELRMKQVRVLCMSNRFDAAFEDALKPEDRMVDQVWMSPAMWAAIVELAGVDALARDLMKRATTIDLGVFDEPFKTLHDITGELCNFVNRLGLRVTT